MFVSNTVKLNAATITPKPIKLQFAPASMDLAMAYSMCSKARPLPWSWVVMCNSRDENEARGGLIIVVGRVPSKKTKKQKKKQRKNRPAQMHHDIHSSPATPTTSRRRATKHIPRISPYSPAYRDPGFVEISLAHLSQLPMDKTASIASFPRPFFLEHMVQKKKKQPITAANNPRSDRVGMSLRAARI